MVGTLNLKDKWLEFLIVGFTAALAVWVSVKMNETVIGQIEKRVVTMEASWLSPRDISRRDKLIETIVLQVGDLKTDVASIKTVVDRIDARAIPPAWFLDKVEGIEERVDKLEER